LKADGTTRTTDMTEAVYVEFTIDQIKATPKNAEGEVNVYVATMKFADKTDANRETFTIKTAIKVVNPTLVLDRITGKFVGDNLTVYGDTQENPSNNTYTLKNAYNTHSYVALSFEEVDAAGETVVASSIASGNVSITTTNMNKPMFVKVTSTLFGNNANTVEETIIVTPKSSIANGVMSIVSGKKLELVYDQTLPETKAKVALSAVLSMTDAETKAVAFLTKNNDIRLATITVEAAGSNSGFIKITEKDGEQTVAIDYGTQGYNNTELTIPIKVTLTDMYGEKYVKSFDFKVKPKA
ncbi:MAG: hypothetical protein RR550_01100, partial [Rikenellaceae bacterium]